MKDIAIYGAGGFGREVACLIRRINAEAGGEWNIIGFFDDGVPAGTRNEYGEVIGNIDVLNGWKTPLAIVFAIATPKIVELLHSKVTNKNVEYPNLIAPDVIFLDKNNVRIGKGNIICSRSLISCNVEIGNFNILNGYNQVGHDTVIGNYNSVMPACKISGGVEIGDRNFLGVNAVILQYKKVADDIVIGASSLVMRNITKAATYIGNPAKKLEF